MQTITVVFTKRNWNPVSALIRWCIPRSRFQVAPASHCLVVDGDYLIEASMLHGVRRVPYVVAMKGQTIVEVVHFRVPDADAGLAWVRTQVGLKYDYPGALGLALAPDREWSDETDWFCFELAAATLSAAGRDYFKVNAHITGTMLQAMKP